jgi:hypothetical protein
MTCWPNCEGFRTEGFTMLTYEADDSDSPQVVEAKRKLYDAQARLQQVTAELQREVAEAQEELVRARRDWPHA